MSYPDCELKEFFFTRLRVDWTEPKKTVTATHRFDFTYDVGTHVTEKNHYRLTFRMKVESDTSETVGYTIDCEIVGFFGFPPEMEIDKVEKLVRINGSTILYGILRGQIAAITGVFPNRKFVLPTFMMQDVVSEIERIKAQKRLSKRATSATQPVNPRKLPARLKK